MKETQGTSSEEVHEEGQQGQEAQQGQDRKQQMVMEAMKARAQAQGGGAGGGGAPQQGGGIDVDGIAEIVQQVAGLIDGLPPEIKQSLGVQLARGKSVADIATQMIQQMQQGAAA